MKQILVYENWRSETPTLIGRLFIEGTRGKEVCSFEYDSKWLKQSSGFILDPDLSLFNGRQFAPVGKELFGIFKDSCPDRWGRTLMDRREAILAYSESRKPRSLTESDSTFLVCTTCREWAHSVSKPRNRGHFFRTIPIWRLHHGLHCAN